MDVAIILAGAGLTVFTALAIGDAVLCLLGIFKELGSRMEAAFFQFGAGAAILSLVVFFLCQLRLANPTAFLLISVSSAAYWVQRWRRRAPGDASLGSPRSMVRWTYIFAPVALLFGSLYLVHGLAPATSPDGVGYHLGLVRQYYNAGGFSDLPTNVYGFLPRGAEMLYLFAYSFGKHSAAKLVHLMFAAGTVAGILSFGVRFATGFWGVPAATLFLCSPLVGVVAPTAYNDCALAFGWLLAFYSLALWIERPMTGKLILAGAAAGFCFSVKYTGFLATPAALATIIYWTRKHGGCRGETFRSVATAAGAAAVFVLPWLIANALTAGNPFAPFLNEWFPNLQVTSFWEDIYVRNMRHFNGFGLEGWHEYLTAPIELSVWGDKVQGIVGPIFLLAPAVALAWRRPLARCLILAAGLAALPWLANTGARFVLPALPFAALGIELGLANLPAPIRMPAALATVVLHSLLSWPSFIPHWHSSWVWRLDDSVPWRAALRLEPEDTYLAARLPSYRTVREVDKVATAEGRVLTLMNLAEAYLDKPIMVSYQGAFNERMMRTIDTPALSELQPSKRTILRLEPRPYSGIRILQQADERYVPWRIAEIQMFNGPRRIEPSAAWELNRPHSPWPAQFLVDGNVSSMWESDSSLRSDMAITIRFPAMPVDRIELIHPDQEEVRVIVEVKGGADNAWRLAKSEPSTEVYEYSVPELRQWAHRELRHNGIDTLVTNLGPNQSNRTAAAIDQDPAAWGFEELSRDEAWRIYRVK